MTSSLQLDTLADKIQKKWLRFTEFIPVDKSLLNFDQVHHNQDRNLPQIYLEYQSLHSQD